MSNNKKEEIVKPAWSRKQAEEAIEKIKEVLTPVNEGKKEDEQDNLHYIVMMADNEGMQTLSELNGRSLYFMLRSMLQQMKGAEQVFVSALTDHIAQNRKVAADKDGNLSVIPSGSIKSQGDA